MEFPALIFFICLYPSVFGFQQKYKMIMENFTVEYVDDNYMHATSGIYKINNTNALNITFTMKIDVPDNLKCLVKAFIWHNDNFHLPIIQLEKTLKDFVEMEMFDLQSLWIRHARPPVVWPLMKNVTYRIERWVPDTTQFPPNLPEGKWKVQITQAFVNKTKLVVYNMFAKTEYHK